MPSFFISRLIPGRREAFIATPDASSAPRVAPDHALGYVERVVDLAVQARIGDSYTTLGDATRGKGAGAKDG